MSVVKMSLKVKKPQNNFEGTILTGLITSDRLLANIRKAYVKDSFSTDMANIIADWCMDYFDRYGKAPNSDIGSIFYAYRDNGALDEDTADLIDSFLGRLSKEYDNQESFNVDFVADQTEQLFQFKSVKTLIAQLQGKLLTGTPAELSEIISEYRTPTQERRKGVDPFINPDFVMDVFDQERTELFKLPGEVGKMIGPISRDDFVCVLAPEKRGKTWWLSEFALRALQKGLKVAFISTGDMNEGELTQRLAMWVKRGTIRKSAEFLLPVLDCEKNQSNACSLAGRPNQEAIQVKKLPKENIEAYPYHQPCTQCRRENPEEFDPRLWWKLTKAPLVDGPGAVKAFQKFKSVWKRGSLRIHQFPSDSASMTDIENLLKSWKQEDGWVPDVLINDYMDTTRSEASGRTEFRHQENNKWLAARRLNQTWHCAYITATQGKAATVNKEFLDQGDASEDKRKLSHVTHAIGLSQSPEDKRQGVMKVNLLIARHSEFIPEDWVNVLYSYRIGHAILDSFISKRRPSKKD